MLESCKTEEIQNYQEVIESLQEDRVERETIGNSVIYLRKNGKRR